MEGLYTKKPEEKQIIFDQVRELCSDWEKNILRFLGLSNTEAEQLLPIVWLTKSTWKVRRKKKKRFKKTNKNLFNTNCCFDKTLVNNFITDTPSYNKTAPEKQIERVLTNRNDPNKVAPVYQDGTLNSNDIVIPPRKRKQKDNPPIPDATLGILNDKENEGKTKKYSNAKMCNTGLIPMEGIASIDPLNLNSTKQSPLSNHARPKTITSKPTPMDVDQDIAPHMTTATPQKEVILSATDQPPIKTKTADKNTTAPIVEQTNQSEPFNHETQMQIDDINDYLAQLQINNAKPSPVSQWISSSTHPTFSKFTPNPTVVAQQLEEIYEDGSTDCESIDEYNISTIKRIKRKDKRVKQLLRQEQNESMHARKAPRLFSYDLRINRKDIDLDACKSDNFQEAKAYLILIFKHYNGFLGVEYVKSKYDESCFLIKFKSYVLATKAMDSFNKKNPGSRMKAQMMQYYKLDGKYITSRDFKILNVDNNIDKKDIESSLRSLIKGSFVVSNIDRTNQTAYVQAIDTTTMNQLKLEWSIIIKGQCYQLAPAYFRHEDLQKRRKFTATFTGFLQSDTTATAFEALIMHGVKNVYEIKNHKQEKTIVAIFENEKDLKSAIARKTFFGPRTIIGFSKQYSPPSMPDKFKLFSKNLDSQWRAKTNSKLITSVEPIGYRVFDKQKKPSLIDDNLNLPNKNHVMLSDNNVASQPSTPTTPTSMIQHNKKDDDFHLDENVFANMQDSWKNNPNNETTSANSVTLQKDAHNISLKDKAAAELVKINEYREKTRRENRRKLARVGVNLSLHKQTTKTNIGSTSSKHNYGADHTKDLDNNCHDNLPNKHESINNQSSTIGQQKVVKSDSLFSKVLSTINPFSTTSDSYTGVVENGC